LCKVDIFINGNDIDCHCPSPEIHLLSMIHIRPRFVYWWDPSPATIPLWPPPSAIRDLSPDMICLPLWSSWFQAFHCSMFNALLWAAFHDVSSTYLIFLMVIVTDLHHVRLPTTLYQSPKINPCDILCMIRKYPVIDSSVWHRIFKSKSMIRRLEHVILFHTIGWIPLDSTWLNWKLCSTQLRSLVILPYGNL
jgi:hypothetical protein